MTTTPTLLELQPVSLDEVLALAELQTRIDRKYILDPAVADTVLGRHTGSLRRLEIDGLSEFRYETTYFDTDDLQSFRSAVHGRRRRFKVRTRSYLDSGNCALEVKTVAGRGHTVKERLGHPIQRSHALDAAAMRFLTTQGLSIDVVERLRPTLVTRYRRVTLVDDTGARITMDLGLQCTTERGTAGIGDRILLETKSPGVATGVDRELWAGGVRPVPVSKYATGLAAIDAGLPSNKWHRTLLRYFVVQPAARVATAVR